MFRSLDSATRFLILALSVFYAAAAIAGPLLYDWTTEQTVFWVAMLLGGAVCMLIGELLLPRGMLAAVIVSLGAIAGGLQLFLTLVVPIAVAAVIACSVALARRPAAA
jgi:biotin transporter BioY